MSDIVVDASVALAWILPSQGTAPADALLLARAEHAFLSPAIFNWEVRNAILAFGRRPAASDQAYEEALAVLDGLDIRADEGHSLDELRELAIFARARRLSLFDAAYLSLALERNCSLASRDGGLLSAAAAAGVACIDLREESE